MEKILSLSVHQLVDFLLRTGDIDNRIYNNATMSQGTLIHAYYQKKQGNEYYSEYYLKQTFEVDDFKVSLDGRADGIIVSGEDVTIDEIKSTVVDLDEYYAEQKEWHLGQAKCYALMYAIEKDLSQVNIRLTYIHQLSGREMIKNFTYTKDELESYVKKLIKDYLEFYKLIYNRIQKRNESASNIKFPFKEFRQGQRKFAKYVFGIALNGGTLFCEAPTGIGKTMSALYPSVKSFSTGYVEKIFYLTAKNSGKESAFNACNILHEEGLNASYIQLTAKDKICFCPGKACNPDECPFAKGYYKNVRAALEETIRSGDIYSRDNIIDIAKNHAICPFEFSLDLSLYTDLIICDYNYFFDPLVYLKRYFDEDATHNVVLVDEAHNLIERGRSMYSASISLHSFTYAKKSVKYLEHKKIKNAIKRISKIFNSYKELPDGETQIDSLNQSTLKSIEAYLVAATDVNRNHHQYVNDDFTNFFFELNKFSKIYELFNADFCLYVSKDDKDTKLNILCLDPSPILRRVMSKVGSRVIFSATLSPSDYYLRMLGGKENDPILKLPSPFSKHNLCLMVAPKVSLKYKDRDNTLEEVVNYIKSAISGRVGNYFIYVPSYEYLSKIEPYLNFDDADVFIQEKDMSDIDRENFLKLFSDKPLKTTIGVVVIGGAFGEGIDLVSDRLIGVIVIGVGLPQICFEKDIIRNYFDERKEPGFIYSYANPGLNKVMQAVGRVIRSENDKGIALLIDNRYLQAPYSDVFGENWSHYKVVTSTDEVRKTVDKFWKNQ